MSFVVTPKPMSAGDKARLKKVLQCLTDDDYKQIKQAAQAGCVDAAIDSLLKDYLQVLTTSVKIVNAIYEYENRFERVQVINLTEERQRAEQERKDLAFAQSLGAWPSQTEKSDEVNSLKAELDLNDFRKTGVSLQPL